MRSRSFIVGFLVMWVGGCNDILGNRLGKAKPKPEHEPIEMVCEPAALESCYTGPMGTAGQGECKSGLHACQLDGMGWGPCLDERLPGIEDCDGQKRDEDCDGLINESGESCVCGDGYISAGEMCDDGNVASGDGCDGDCRLRVTALAAGVGHSCAVLSEASVKCWGRNSDGQLGQGDTITRGDGPGEMGASLPAVDLGSGKKVISISSRYYHSCVLLEDGIVKCWGANKDGQLGLGDRDIRGDDPGEMGMALPLVDLGSGVSVNAISVGGYHTCALLSDGKIKCWGRNGNGQLGLGNIDSWGAKPGEMGDSLPAVDLGPGFTATAVHCGAHHTCALLLDGSVKCWGANSLGQLGLGDMNHRGDDLSEMGTNLPTVNLGTGAIAVAIAIGGYHSCALLQTGQVKCWGYNTFGTLGLGNTITPGDGSGEMGDSLPPVELGAKAEAIAAGGSMICALLETGALKCWGLNDAGQLGLGNKVNMGDDSGEMGNALLPVDLGVGMKVAAVVMGEYHVCARLENGFVKCWGANTNGQLGLGDISHRGDQPGEMGDTLPFIKLFNDQY